MLRNYLKVAIRNLMRNRVHSLINVIGLAAGMACCALILLYVQHELGYDRFHAKGERLYRVLRETRGDDGESMLYSGQSGRLAPAMMDDFPEIEAAVRMAGNAVGLWPVHRGQRHRLPLLAALLVESNFLEVCDFELVRGERQKALQEPYSVVLSEETARRFFGGEDPIGQSLRFDASDFAPKGEFIVTGIARLPKNSSLRFEALFLGWRVA